MTETTDLNTFDLNHLLYPGEVFPHPMDVVADPDMSVQEKRAILASWASDVSNLAALPDCRDFAAAPVVRFDDIIDALKQLDVESGDKTQAASSTALGFRTSLGSLRKPESPPWAAILDEIAFYLDGSERRRAPVFMDGKTRDD